jgi:tetratricopeptide (TPR) repeat protein
MRARARWGGAAAALAAFLATSCGRQAPSKPAAEASAAATPTSAPSDAQDVASRTRRAAGQRTPVIWLGFDGFDFELVDRLAAAGRMPNWKKLSSEGYTARLKSYMPILSPVVWTTLATGVGPEVHRVLDFQELDPSTGQRVPISGHSRAVPAIWNVASEAGLSVGVVGWWATHPAEEVKGFFVSDRASPILFDGLPRDGVVYPASLSAGVEQIIAREASVDDAELARFVAMPLTEIASHRAEAKGLQDPIAALARTIGATRVESRIARELYDRNLPDLTMLYFEGTDVIGHLFASYVAPKMACVSDSDFARYGHAAEEYYALADRILGQWMRRAEEDGATLIVNSDHGFKWGSDRSCEKGSLNPETAGFWHRLDGVFAAWGARVRPGRPRGAASVFDVPATVSALLGLPVDRRAVGTPIREAFDGLSAPERRDLSGVPVRRLETAGMSEKEASEYAKKLMALGYLSGSEPGRLAPSGGDRPGLTDSAWNNLGLYLCGNPGKKDLAAAETAYRKALELRPDYGTAMTNLAALYLVKGDDRQAIDWIFRSLAAGYPNPDDTILDWAVRYQARGKRREAREVLERGAKAFPDSEVVNRALALDDYTAKRCPSADQTLGRFEAATQSPETLNALALIRACLGRREDAVALFRKSLAIAPGQPTVVQSLSVLEAGAAQGRRQGS